jgi:hypothetical protein
MRAVITQFRQSVAKKWRDMTDTNKVDISTDNLPDAEKQAELDRMLSNHPGSELTQEQLEAIENGTLASSDSLVRSAEEKMVLELLKMGDEEFSAVESAVLQARQQRSGNHGEWKKGVLPGGVYIKTHSASGRRIEIEKAEWDKLPN